MSNYFTRWSELSAVKKELAERDWFYGTSGNLSIKVTDEPLTFLVTASGKDKRTFTNHDFLLVDERGKQLEETTSKPSAETLLHAKIYNKTKAGCVLHVHTIDNNVITELYKHETYIEFTGNEIIKALGSWEQDAKVYIPIIPNVAHIPTLAEQFDRYVKGDTGAILIQNHGITVWGRDAFEAKKVLEAWEFLFSYQVKVATIKNVVGSF
jgi:methylthioribulose-1-phosphate dehydratase